MNEELLLDPDLGGTDDLKSDLRDLRRSPEVKFDQNCPKFEISRKTLNCDRDMCKAERSEALTAGRSPAPPAGASWRSQLVSPNPNKTSVRHV